MTVTVVIYHQLMLMRVDVQDVRSGRQHFHYQRTLYLSACAVETQSCVYRSLLGTDEGEKRRERKGRETEREVRQRFRGKERKRAGERDHNFVGPIGFRAPLGTCSGRLAVLLVDETEKKPDNAREPRGKSPEKEKRAKREREWIQRDDTPCSPINI